MSIEIEKKLKIKVDQKDVESLRLKKIDKSAFDSLHSKLEEAIKRIQKLENSEPLNFQASKR